jgi:hypothetical protein
MASNFGKKVRDSIQSHHSVRDEKVPRRKRSKSVLEILEENIENPADDDILLGRNRAFWSRPGNQRFRSFVGTYVKQYIESSERNEKTKIGHDIYDELSKLGRRFLKFDSSTNMWNQVGKKQAREKIGHTLRDAVALRTKYNIHDEKDLILALTSIDPQDHHWSGMFSSTSSSNSSNSSKSRNFLSTSMSSILSTVKGSRRMGESLDQSSTKPLAMNADQLLMSKSFSLKDTLDSSESSIFKPIKCTTPSTQLKTNCDFINDAKHLVSPAHIERRTKVLNASNNHRQLTDECSFDNLIDSVLDDNHVSSNEVGDLELMSVAKTATDDELSAGYSAMSLDMSKSTMNASLSISKSNVYSRRSVFSFLKSSRQPSSLIKKRNEQEFTSYPQRRSSCKPSHNDCDESMGIDILGDAGDICSLEVSTLTSYQTKSTRGSGQSWPMPFIAPADICQDASVKSFETEIEFRKVLTDLRGNWK